MVADNDVTVALASVPLLAGLSHKDLRKVAARGKVVDHSSGQEVTEQGGHGVGFHVILTGSALVEVGGKPRRELGPGDYFGEITLLDGKPRTATVRVGESGLQTWSLTAWDFDELLNDEPSLARPMLRGLAGRLREAESRET
ncbi:MAG: cyclic nucleotide-binding domain-containing protein [Pseudonocardiales bacterium]